MDPNPAAPLAAPHLAPALPVGARLLHIGPSKTGTTSLQGACWEGREALAGQGVLYAGGRRHYSAAPRALLGLPGLYVDHGKPPARRHWRRLADEIRGARAPRVLYSSELLAHADSRQARRIVGELGSQVHVLVTLRPLHAILASLWQQRIQAGSTHEFEPWLQRMLDAESIEAGESIWRMHRHGDLVNRWAEAVSPERVRVAVLAPHDHGFLFRVVEDLLAVRRGTLVPRAELRNRSLTAPEAEAIRQVNVQARDAGVTRGARNQLVLAGAARALKERPAPPGSPRVRLPRWAADVTTELGRQAAASIAASGVEVVGDLDLLTRGPGVVGDQPAPVACLDPSSAAAMAVGVALGTGLALGRDEVPESDPPALGFVGSSELLRVLARRAGARIRLRLPARPR